MHTSLLVAVDQWLVRSLKQEIMCSELDIYSICSISASLHMIQSSRDVSTHTALEKQFRHYEYTP